MTLSAPWRTVGHIVLLVLCLSVLIPMAVALGTAFKPANEVFAIQPWPDHPTLANFFRLFDKAPFHLYIWNSVGTTGLRVGGQLVIAASVKNKVIGFFEGEADIHQGFDGKRDYKFLEPGHGLKLVLQDDSAFVCKTDQLGLHSVQQVLSTGCGRADGWGGGWGGDG